MPLLLKFGNPRQCGRKLFLQLGDQRLEFSVIGSQTSVLFLKRHAYEYIIVYENCE